MDLVLDHPRQQSQAAGIDYRFPGSAIEIAGDRLDAAILHTQVGVEAAAFIDEFGILDQSADIGGSSLATATGVVEVFGHRVFTTRAQGLAA